MKTIITSVIFIIILQSCVQKTHHKTITFKVNMNGIENVEKVGIKGNFTNPSWKETIPMTDLNNDGIYEATLTQKTAANSIQFKFVNQYDQYELKDKPNRRLTFKYQPQTLIYNATFNKTESTINEL